MIDLKNVIQITKNNKIIKTIHDDNNNLIYEKPRLPIEYEELDYIISVPVRCYITLNYYPNIETEVVCKYNAFSSGKMLFNSKSASGGTDNFSSYLSGNGAQRFDGTLARFNYIANQDCICKLNKTGYYNNDVLHPFDTIPSNFTSSEKLKVGNNSSSQSFDGKIYYFKVYDNNNLMFDLVPCKRKIDNIYGFYDLINEEFLTSNGSGNYRYE